MRSAMRNRLANLRTLVRRTRSTSDLEVIEVAQLMWASLDTPLSLGLSLLAKANQLEDLLKVEVDPRRYLDSDGSAYADDSQAVSFLKKMPLEIEGVDREKAAWEKFQSAESTCQLTNARFRSLREGHGCDPAVAAILHAAQWKISHWLRDLDAKSWALRCRFGPGADQSTTGPRVSAYHKLSALSSTEDFADGAVALAYCHPSWARSLSGLAPEDHGPVPGFMDIEIVPGNRLTFVPKTALVDRSIAIEPRMNIYAQLGLGALLRQRLKRFAGLDLDDQGPSRELARRASLGAPIATIDLSSASDTISRELVRDLLPSPWYNAMDWCRSKVGLYSRDGQESILIQYEKFSSMGNGFTFELESMIFYALALSCCEYYRDDSTLVRVYGDDIAYPARSVEQLVKVLQFCGFMINPKKSFTSGCFYESCGADYFNGKNVRPYYQKETLQYAESVFRLANGVRRAAARRNRFYGCDVKLRPVWRHIVGLLPPSCRDLKGPFRSVPVRSFAQSTCRPEVDVTYSLIADDSYIACNLDEAMSSPFVKRNPDGWDGWLYAAAVSTGKYVSTNYGDHAVLYTYSLYSGRDGVSAITSPHSTEGNRKIPLRGSGPRQVLSRCFSPSFFDVGPWC